MTLNNTAQQDAGARFVATIAQHLVRVWRDPDLQTVLRREAKQFFVNVAAEARAASQRNRG